MISDYHKRTRVGINRINEFVWKRHNGKCLSTQYINNRSNLLFECKYGHQWKAIWSNIWKGKWCPSCRELSGERITRLYFESIFKAKFPKCRPDWLIAPSGYRLELDGYNSNLLIAFEHQGMQHYILNEFCKNEDKLAKIQLYDEIKIQKCKERGVKLVIVPQVPNLTTVEHLPILIKEKLQEVGIDIDQNSIDIKPNLDLEPLSFEYLKRYREIAQSRGGKCLSEQYINSDTKLDFQCANGHFWSSLPYNISKGHWCKMCHETYIDIRIKSEK